MRWITRDAGSHAVVADRRAIVAFVMGVLAIGGRVTAEPAAASIVGLARAKPPRALSEFRAEFDPGVEVETGTDPTVAFRLICRRCAGVTFAVSEALADLGPVGLDAHCLGCGRVAQVFNATSDGYDGVLGNNDFLKRATSSRGLVDAEGGLVGPVRLRVEVSFSIPLEELTNLARQAAAEPQDLFDWFHLYAQGDKRRVWREVWDFECA